MNFLNTSIQIMKLTTKKKNIIKTGNRQVTIFIRLQ